MALPTVFLSYNPQSETEQTLAVRLFTIGGVSGFTMQLPDRGASGKSVGEETAYRIRMSDYFMLFSTSAVSPVVRQEILIASQKFKDPSRVVVIYDRKVGKDSLSPALCTEVYIDLKADPAVIIQQIAAGLSKPGQKKGKSFFTELGGILLAGLGLFKLARLSYYPGFDDGQLSMAHEDVPQYVQYVVKRPRKGGTPKPITGRKKNKAVEATRATKAVKVARKRSTGK